jgi:hypothetical protein
MGARHIALNATTEKSVYVFLLLLSTYGHDAGLAKNDGAKFFEEVCAEAARQYLGGEEVQSRVFGFPRRLAPKDFPGAVDTLCRDLGEGTACRNRPTVKNQKDAGLDIVAWRDFPDRREGKLISFGQCATGRDWPAKLTDLQPAHWCGLWMQDRPAVVPVRFFFVPHCLDRVAWVPSCFNGGVLFDRCRIAHFVPALPKALASAIGTWSSHVLANCVRGGTA